MVQHLQEDQCAKIFVTRDKNAFFLSSVLQQYHIRSSIEANLCRAANIMP